MKELKFWLIILIVVAFAVITILCLYYPPNYFVDNQKCAVSLKYFFPIILLFVLVAVLTLAVFAIHYHFAFLKLEKNHLFEKEKLEIESMRTEKMLSHSEKIKNVITPNAGFFRLVEFCKEKKVTTTEEKDAAGKVIKSNIEENETINDDKLKKIFDFYSQFSNSNVNGSNKENLNI